MKPGTRFPNGLRRNQMLQLGIVVAAVGIVLIYDIVEEFWQISLTLETRLVFHAIVFGAGAYFLSGWIVRLRNERSQMQDRLDVQADHLNTLQQRQTTVFHLARKFVEASDEQEVIDQVLELALRNSGALGASFVPFDERGQPQAATSQGTLPDVLMEPWAEHLASPHVRNRCSACRDHQANGQHAPTCPLLTGPLTEEIPGLRSVHCLPVRCGEREVGVLNLYMGAERSLDTDQERFLHAVVDEMALGLEGIRLRKRELTSLQQLRAIRQRTDINLLLADLVQNIQQTLKADFALLVLVDLETNSPKQKYLHGELSSHAQLFAEGVLQGVLTSGDPVFIGDVITIDNASREIRALLAAPLVETGEPALGAILVGHRQAQNFTRRQLVLLQSIAGQVALVVKNANLVSELEYNTMLKERTRLAREIHDGLAQTLGFLKLHLAQMMNVLERGQVDRLREMLKRGYDTLATAYIDVRDAIDGLRLRASEEGFSGWMEQILVDFQEQSGAQAARTNLEVLDSLPLEIQAQLVRIVQEALNNARKHARASQVWLTCVRNENELVLEIGDNGRGFSPHDVSPVAQYGLRGMRERAELIGADFQVISTPEDGTRIRLSLLQTEQEFTK